MLRIISHRTKGGAASIVLSVLSATEVMLLGQADPPPRLLQTLTAIHQEVKELGPRPGQSFIQWDFFFGSNDDDDTNKDHHVVVLIQPLGEGERLTLRVTRMETVRDRPGVSIAAESRLLSCLFRGGPPTILSSDFKESELEGVLEDILKAVRNKKRLLRSGPHGC